MEKLALIKWNRKGYVSEFTFASGTIMYLQPLSSLWIVVTHNKTETCDLPHIWSKILYYLIQNSIKRFLNLTIEVLPLKQLIKWEIHKQVMRRSQIGLYSYMFIHLVCPTHSTSRRASNTLGESEYQINTIFSYMKCGCERHFWIKNNQGSDNQGLSCLGAKGTREN